MLDRYKIETKEQREYLEYVNQMIQCVEDDKFEEVRASLERCFDDKRLSDLKLASRDIVRIRDDMNERMRLYRNKSSDLPLI